MRGSEKNNHWIFGYGSLMWRPGFEFVDRQIAELDGFHRSLCVYSHVHRGTKEQPGLVFGLDHGGSCTGIAYSVAPENWQSTFKYLQEREQVTSVYLDSFQEITLASNSTNVTALTFLVDRDHQQYAGKLSIDKQLQFIRQGIGQSGNCHDYVMSSAEHLQELGIEDENVQALAKVLSQVGS